jgi:hypothetical protein
MSLISAIRNLVCPLWASVMEFRCRSDWRQEWERACALDQRVKNRVLEIVRKVSSVEGAAPTGFKIVINDCCYMAFGHLRLTVMTRARRSRHNHPELPF